VIRPKLVDELQYKQIKNKVMYYIMYNIILAGCDNYSSYKII